MNNTPPPETRKPDSPQGQRASEALTKIQERLAKGELTEVQAQELIEQEIATADSAAA